MSYLTAQQIANKLLQVTNFNNYMTELSYIATDYCNLHEIITDTLFSRSSNWIPIKYSPASITQAKDVADIILKHFN